MDRKTGRKYVAAGALPSEMAKARDWRTREDAFATQWPEVEVLLRESPVLEAKPVFEMLVEKYPGRFEEGQLRTLQRRVKTWRAEQGPDKDVPHHGVEGDLEYLRILHLAASALEADVEAALSLLLGEKKAICSEVVQAMVTAKTTIAVPDVTLPPVDLGAYDALLEEVGT